MQASHGFERKHYFIDRKFQGRYMLTFLVPMLVMLVFMLLTLGGVSRVLLTTTANIIREDVDNVVAARLQDRVDPEVEDYQNAIENVRTYLRTYSTNTKYRKVLVSALLWVFGIGVFVVIIETVLMTIYFSHRVAGPVYRFEKTCHALIDGNYTDSIHLRKGDEMQNLARLMNQMTEVTRGRLAALAAEEQVQKRADLVDGLKL